MLPNKHYNTENRKYRNKGKVHYSTKEYANPFFTGKKRKKIRTLAMELSLRTKFIIFGFVIIIILSCWLFFYSNVFIIKQMEVRGEGRIAPSAIEKIAWQQIQNNFFILFPQKNIFFFSKNKLTHSLKEKYSFNELDIEKKLPNTLLIKFREKEYSLIWHEGNNYYYADEKGDIVAEANLLEVEQKDYPMVDNMTELKISGDKITVSLDYLNFIIALFHKLKDYDELPVERFTVDSEVNTVKTIIRDGPTIYFNIEEQMEKQIEKLVIIKSERIKDNFSEKLYIDLRYGDVVYYR